MLNRRTGVLLSTSLPYGVKAMTQRKENSETQRYSDIILEKSAGTQQHQYGGPTKRGKESINRMNARNNSLIL
jgi:hypothetical protein